MQLIINTTKNCINYENLVHNIIDQTIHIVPGKIRMVVLIGGIYISCGNIVPIADAIKVITIKDNANFHRREKIPNFINNCLIVGL